MYKLSHHVKTFPFPIKTSDAAIPYWGHTLSGRRASVSCCVECPGPLGRSCRHTSTREWRGGTASD